MATAPRCPPPPPKHIHLPNIISLRLLPSAFVTQSSRFYPLATGHRSLVIQRRAPRAPLRLSLRNYNFPTPPLLLNSSPPRARPGSPMCPALCSVIKFRLQSSAAFAGAVPTAFAPRASTTPASNPRLRGWNAPSWRVVPHRPRFTPDAAPAVESCLNRITSFSLAHFNRGEPNPPRSPVVS